jgi:hypothetical protein
VGQREKYIRWPTTAYTAKRRSVLAYTGIKYKKRVEITK